MQSFFSSALGTPYEYRAWLSDKFRIGFLAHANEGGDLRARKQGDSSPYQLVAHTAPQVKQVSIDMDKAELNLP